MSRLKDVSFFRIMPLSIIGRIYGRFGFRNQSQRLTITKATLQPANYKSSTRGTTYEQMSARGPFVFHPASATWEPYTKEKALPHLENSDHQNPAPLRFGDILNILTWNIDFGTPFARQRGITALRHIQEKASQPPFDKSIGSVILLQEVADPGPRTGPVPLRHDRDSSTLAGILEDEWVRREFLISDITLPDTYGTVTLVSKHIAMAVPSGEPTITNSVTMAVNSQQRNQLLGKSTASVPTGCFRVPAPGSVMGRDILSVDLILESEEILRICNVHLESLAIGTRIRPLQLALVSEVLREQPISSGIVAGDMNAIDISDFTLPNHEDIELRDVWAEYNGQLATLTADSENVGHKEISSENVGRPTWGEEKGHTWGYQSGKTIFYPRRMDKILFRVNGNAKTWIEPMKEGTIDRLGVDLNAKITALENQGEVGTHSAYGRPKDEEGGEEEDEEDYLPVSDHFGLITRFIVVSEQQS